MFDRHGRRRVGWIGVTLAALLHAAVAGAQDVTREARALFEQGVAASDGGRYADAVQLFERSMQLRASPVVLRNLAIAYRGVGRLIDAARAFEQYFANPGARATPEDLAQLRAEFEGIVRDIPELRFEVSPGAATLSVDGRAVSDRTAALRIDPGTHVIEAGAEDFSPQRIELQLQRGERRRVTVTLAQRTADGRVAIETNVPNARIELDGALAGTQTADLPASPGEHTLVVSAPGYRPLRRTVTVGRHGTARVSVVLQRSPGFPPWATATIVGGSLVAVGIATWIIVDRTRDPFVPPTGPTYWGEVAFPP
jgi:hypothetical protein